MDEITRLIKDLIRLLQTIAEAEEEDCCEKLLESANMSEIKQELGSWFIADYPLYQGA
ncbi:MAG TPA: hypothetical protein VMW67_02780 [Desulfobacteria bacterium]|nr:hypothetical protein [Desulfobacteria bacterium]